MDVYNQGCHSSSRCRTFTSSEALSVACDETYLLPCEVRHDFRDGMPIQYGKSTAVKLWQLMHLAHSPTIPTIAKSNNQPSAKALCHLTVFQVDHYHRFSRCSNIEPNNQSFHLELPDKQVCCITLGTDPTRTMEAHTNGPRKNTTWTCPCIQMYLVHFLPLSGNHRQAIQLNQDQASLKIISASPLVTQNGPTGIQTNVLARTPRLGHLCVSR